MLDVADRTPAVLVEETAAGRVAVLDLGAEHDMQVLSREDLLRLERQVRAALAVVEG